MPKPVVAYLYNNNCTCHVIQVSKKDVSKSCGLLGPDGAFLHAFLSCKVGFAASHEKKSCCSSFQLS